MPKPAQRDQEKEVAGERLPSLPHETLDESPDEAALYALLSELEGDDTGAKVTIWRVSEQITGRGAGKDQYLVAMTPTDFEQYGLAGIQNDYGAGIYRIKITSATGVFLANKVFPIGPPPRSRAPAPTPSFSQPTPTHNGNTDFAALIAAMQQGFNGLANILVQQGGAQEERLLDKLQKYKLLFGGGSVQPAGPVADPINQLSSLITIVKEAGLVGDGGSSKSTIEIVADVAKEFMPAITAVVGAQLAGRQPAQARPQPQPAPQPAQPAQPNVALPFPPQTQESQLSPIDNQVKGILPMLLPLAMSGADSYKYADMVLDYIDIGTAEALANRADWFEWLCSLNPGVANMRPWFEGLRTNLLSAIAAEKQGDLTNGQELGLNVIGAQSDDE